MWFITIAFKRGGNKQLSNSVINLGLGHHGTWVGLAQFFLEECEKDVLWNGQTIWLPRIEQVGPP
jgi:hypothetical protein